MENRRRPEFIREILEGDSEVDPIGDGRMFKYYIIAAVVGTVVAMGGLIGRGCYHKISGRYNASQNEPERQEKPATTRRN